MAEPPDNPETDRISEKQIRDLLKQLEKERTVLTLNLIGRDYERLTIVTGFKKIGPIPHFIIDYPHEFKEKIGTARNERMKFEFIGLDKIQYVFRATVTGIAPDGILVQFPEYIERIQRRRFFRIAPPLGTKLIFLWNAERHALDVIDISEGGALINREKKGEKTGELAISNYLTNVAFFCPEKGFKLKVAIEKAIVKRVDLDAETGRRYYAVQFLNMNQKETNKLNNFIYSYQREILRRRYLLERG
ncbi:MAG: PilZ domain-containing protein [Desulfobacteraceae bacterium]|nr:MAG: PilZ domain-containing protein [Desulfobacteraceae bacterium]